MIETQSKAERNALRMGKKSLSRWNSPVFFLLTFLVASAIGAVSSWSWYQRDSADFHRFLRIIVPYMWATVWFAFGCLWYERRVFFRIIERLASGEGEAKPDSQQHGGQISSEGAPSAPSDESSP